MKQSLLIVFTAFLISPLFAQYEVRGGSGLPLLATENGITKIYLLNGLAGAQIKFTSSQSSEHQWYRYSESIDDAIPIPCTQSGNASVITDIQEGYGYYVDSPIGTGYVWIIDYSRYVPQFYGLRVTEDEYRCKQLKLIADADVAPVYYYTSGRRNTLQREFLLTYNTLEWKEEQKMFIPADAKLVLNENEIFSEISVYSPPLMNTTFMLTDSFAVHFGIEKVVTSDMYSAIKVEAHAFAETNREFGENEIHSTDGTSENSMGGSAPIEYTFTAYANEPVASHYVWKISRQDSVTNEMIVRYTKVLQYNFEKDGVYQVELEVSDVSEGQAICVDTPPPFRITINSTVIKIPNAFSPGSSIGVNDELKVAFTSVMSFKASVFNRWGNLLFQWSDPSKGWDGRVNGKFVPTGVYYVIVEYKDSNGKSRSMSKAVNVLRAKNQ